VKRLRIVLVSYHFAPGSAAGATRPHGLARQLVGMGHRVVVVTAEPAARSEDFDVISVPDTGLARALKRAAGGTGSESVATLVGGRREWLRAVTERAVRFGKAVVAHPDERGRWSRAAVRAFSASGHTGAADWVIATGPPFSVFFAGGRIAGETSARLVLDYRDLWTQSAYYPFGRLRRALDVRRERGMLRAADRVVTTTSIAAAQLAASFPNAPGAQAVYTGIVLEEWRTSSSETAAPLLVLSHFGSLYEGRRDLDLVARGLASIRDELAESGYSACVRLYGRRDGHAEEAFQRLGMSQQLEYMGGVPRDVIPDRLAETDAAILAVWDNPEDRCSLPSKAIEYLASGVHIIVVGARPGSEVHTVLGGFVGVDLCECTEDVVRAVRYLMHRRTSGEHARYDRTAQMGRFREDSMARSYLSVLEGGESG